MGTKWKNAKRPFWFWKLSLSFSVLVLAPLIMGVITYILTYGALLEQAKQSSILRTQNAMTLMENSLSNVNDLASLLGADKDVRSLVQLPVERRQEMIYSMLTLKNELPAIKDSNNLIDGYFIYSLRNESIIAPQQGFPDSSLFYDRYYAYGDMNYSQWKQEILLTQNYNSPLPARRMKYGPERRSILLYPCPVRNSVTQCVIGTIFFRVNSSQVQALMFPNQPMDSSQIFILNKQGEALISSIDSEVPSVPDGLYTPSRKTSSFQETIDGIPMFVSYCTSEKQDLVFVAATPLAVIRNQSTGVLLAIVISLLVLYFGSVVLAGSLFGRQHGYLLRIADKLASKKTPALSWKYDGIRYIDDGISGLLYDNADLTAIIQQQKLQIKSIQFSRLVNGGFQDHAALEKFIRSMGISIVEKQFRGAYLAFQEQDLSIQLQAVLETIAPCEMLIPYAFADETNRFAILYQGACLQTPAEETMAVTNLFSNIYQTLSDVYHLETVVYIGYVCDDLLYINKSFESASQMMNMHSNDTLDSHFLYIAESPRDTKRYCYSVQAQQKLANLILVNDLAGIDQLLNNVYEENFTKRELSEPMRELLYAQLVGTLLSCNSEATVALEAENLLCLKKPKEFFEQIRRQCHAVSLDIRLKNESHTARGMDDICQYIHDHFTSSDLSLSYIALKYHMSESYLSMSIKNHLGQNFQNYVEQLRIQKANELMQTTALPIQEISEKVGYLSPHSFRRAYKKVMGHTPSQFPQA